MPKWIRLWEAAYFDARGFLPKGRRNGSERKGIAVDTAGKGNIADTTREEKDNVVDM